MKNQTKNIGHRLFSLPILPLILCPIILFFPFLFQGKALFWGTPALQFVPWWSWAWDTVLSGNFPLWNPLVGMGAPLVANYQSAIFYPPNWIYLLLNIFGGSPAIAWGQAFLVTIHLIWAGVGMAVLCRRLGINKLGQTISGLAFCLSGYLVARAGFISINSAVSWLPWVLLASLNLVISKRQSFRLVVLGVVIGLQLLAGHAQTTWYSLLFAGIWFLYWSFRHYREDHITKISPIISLQFLIYFANSSKRFVFGLCTGILLSAVQLFPTLEYLIQSQRVSAVDYEHAMTYSFWPWRLLTLIAPDLFGNPGLGNYWGYGNYWEDAVYVGVLPLLLAAGVVFNQGKVYINNLKQRKGAISEQPKPLWFSLVVFLLLTTIISFILAFGKNTPVFVWLYKNIPTFDLFQAPTRISIIGVFSLCLLAGIGANHWQRPGGKGLYWTRLGTAGALAMSIGTGLAWITLGDVSPTFIRASALAGMWALGAGLLSLCAKPKDEIKDSSDLTRKKGTYWVWGVTIWVAADLLVAGWGLNPGIELDFYRGDSSTSVLIKSNLNSGRLYLSAKDEYSMKYERFLRFDRFDTFHRGEGEKLDNWLNLREVMLPNLNMLDNIPSVNNFDPLIPGRYSIWMDILEDVGPEGSDIMFNLMGVSMLEIINDESRLGVDYISVGEGKRFRWTSCKQTLVDMDTEFPLMLFENSIDIDVVYLEADDYSREKQCIGNGEAKITLLDERPNEINVNVNTSSSGWLVIADTWYPGWKAWVNGESVQLLRANYQFKAIEIPQGDVFVKLSYQPSLFTIGLFISGFTCLVILYFMFNYFFRSK